MSRFIKLTRGCPGRPASQEVYVSVPHIRAIMDGHRDQDGTRYTGTHLLIAGGGQIEVQESRNQVLQLVEECEAAGETTGKRLL